MRINAYIHKMKPCRKVRLGTISVCFVQQHAAELQHRIAGVIF